MTGVALVISPLIIISVRVNMKSGVGDIINNFKDDNFNLPLSVSIFRVDEQRS